MSAAKIDSGGKKDSVDLFIQIVELVSDHQVVVTRLSKVGAMFADLNTFSPLDYELCLYALEASTKRVIDPSFYEGDATEDFDLTISEFIHKYLSEDVSDDPLFVARQIKKFARSASWDARDGQEPGNN